MVDKQQMQTLNRILELLDTACQGCLELIAQINSGNTALAERLLGDLQAVAAAAGRAQEPLLPALEHAYTVEQIENTEDTLERIAALLRDGMSERAADLAEFQLLPFLRQLSESFYFWGLVYPDRERMELYYRDEFAEHYRNLYIEGDEPLPYQMTIVVSGYNHLDSTKRCITQLLKETDFEKLNAELVLIDHGSTDGTLEYFESLGIGRVIHFKRNVRIHMLAIAFRICRGEYYCFISNDVLVGRNWAENLLGCLQSDESAVLAVPATPNTSNLQWMLSAPEEPAAFLAWAERRNSPNAALWNDRARIMPNMGIYRAKLVNRIGYADPLFYSMEFWDDDFSLRARRAGYRQVLCEDTACYHFGSITGKAVQKKENTLVYGRELFRQKNGIDAWGSGFCYEYAALRIIGQAVPRKNGMHVLGLDCGMGDTPLQIRNELRRFGCGCELYLLTVQSEYMPDQSALSGQTAFAPASVEGLKECFAGVSFDLIVLGRELSEYEGIPDLIRAASARLAPDGWLIAYCDNPFFAPRLFSILQFALPDQKDRFTAVQPQDIRKKLESCCSRVEMVSATEEVNGVGQFAARYFDNPKKIIETLRIRRYFFICRK